MPFTLSKFHRMKAIQKAIHLKAKILLSNGILDSIIEFRAITMTEKLLTAGDIKMREKRTWMWIEQWMQLGNTAHSIWAPCFFSCFLAFLFQFSFTFVQFILFSLIFHRNWIFRVCNIWMLSFGNRKKGSVGVCYCKMIGWLKNFLEFSIMKQQKWCDIHSPPRDSESQVVFQKSIELLNISRFNANAMDKSQRREIDVSKILNEFK